MCAPLHFIRSLFSNKVATLDKNWDDIVWTREGNPNIQRLADEGDASEEEIAKLLIETGVKVDSCDKDGWTLLHFACRREWMDMVKALVRQGWDLNTKDKWGKTPMMVAANWSCLSIIEYLIECGADVDSCDNKGKTMLHFACRRGWLKIAKALVTRGCNLNAKDSKGRTPLMVATDWLNSYVVEYLIESGVDVDGSCVGGKNLLSFACERGWLGVVKSLVGKGWDINGKDERGKTPLASAADGVRPFVVEYLIKCGAYVENSCDGVGQTLLHYACLRGWLEVVKCVVSKGQDINVRDWRGRTPLLKAADWSSLDIIEYLIECGADVYCSSEDGRTLLHFACERGWLEVVESLVEKGCDLNARDKRGRTPLSEAAWSSPSVIEYLIESGADVDGCDADGWKLLHFACRRGHSLEIVKSLTKKPSNVNALTFQHYTPLHLAVEEFNLEIIKHLLNAGADCNIKNTMRKTAFNRVICKSLSLDVITLFIRKGAYFQADDYAIISNNSLLKEGILQNATLCTEALVNKFNNADLPKIYEIPALSEILPSIEDLKIASESITQDFEESVKFEIESKGYCDLLNTHPICLRSLCVKSLVEYSELL